MRRKYFVILCILISFLSAKSQDIIETFHLKKGGIIKGVVTEKKPYEYIKIRVSSGDIMEFSYSEIVELSTGELLKEGKNNQQQQQKEISPVENINVHLPSVALANFKSPENAVFL